MITKNHSLPRPAFSSLLPLNFKLLEIFDEPSSESNLEESKHNPDLKSKNWKLSYFIGYVKHHYIALIRQDNIWYACEDLMTETYWKYWWSTCSRLYLPPLNPPGGGGEVQAWTSTANFKTKTLFKFTIIT